MVSVRFLKEVAIEISSALTMLFNASLQQIIFPADWKEELINSTYTKGKNNPGIACKLLEHIIYSNHYINGPLRYYRQPP